jgi:hypothetical protein
MIHEPHFELIEIIIARIKNLRWTLSTAQLTVLQKYISSEQFVVRNQYTKKSWFSFISIYGN